MSVAPPRSSNKARSKHSPPVQSPSSPNGLKPQNDLSSKSYVNLTTSALAGVFGSQVSLAELTGDVSAASGAEVYDLTNKPSTTIQRPKSKKDKSDIVNHHPSLPSLSSNQSVVRFSIGALVPRIIALFAIGVVYGEIARNLHDNHSVPSDTLNVVMSQNAAYFSAAWGTQGILLGFLLPLFDWIFSSTSVDFGKGGTDWSSIIRAVAAFLGIAYGVRKLPWESSMQAAAMWGLLNPFLWYILDATRNGFILSSLVAIVGSSVFALLFPSHVPAAKLDSPEYISVIVWIASAYFISSICFGNIGRRMLTFGANAR
ncbi:hypothetical protein D0Z00_002698 [Geotrichum galactomycetum]|uniref:Uncharacterized protein n=1 Tax=Geotrichum galactomycetum TaxID=27317 RepID=A0ACB6V3D9_9ASCO|nr:hypothetical protein D0Z00_002698 [Geotrichum candidum]